MFDTGARSSKSPVNILFTHTISSQSQVIHFSNYTSISLLLSPPTRLDTVHYFKSASQHEMVSYYSANAKLHFYNYDVDSPSFTIYFIKTAMHPIDVVIGYDTLQSLSYQLLPSGTESFTIPGLDLHIDVANSITAPSAKVFKIDSAFTPSTAHPPMSVEEAKDPHYWSFLFPDIYNTEKITSELDYELEFHNLPTTWTHKSYSVSPQHEPIVDQFIKDNLEKGIITPHDLSNGILYTCPIFVTPPSHHKKSKVVVDFRVLNNHIKYQTIPLPDLSMILNSIGNYKVFSILDLSNAYSQIKIENSKIGIATSSGVYRINRLLYGLNSSPAIFSIILRGLLTKIQVDSKTTTICSYLDDIIIMSSCEEENMKVLYQVFELLDHFNLRMNPKKLQLLTTNFKFLGFSVTDGHLSINQDHLEVLKKLQPPQTPKQKLQVIGFYNYFSRFIPQMAHYLKVIRDSPIGSKDLIHCFETLRNCLLNHSKLLLYKANNPLFIFVDASLHSIGAFLAQKVDADANVYYPVGFMSYQLTATQSRYKNCERELLALLVTLKKFSKFLNHDTTVFTDNSQVLSLSNSKKSVSNQSRIIRFLQDITAYDVKFKHIPGSSNTIADFLSRYDNLQDPKFIPNQYMEDLDFETILDVQESNSIVAAICH